MSLLDARPRCDCCSTKRQLIKRHLDPENMFDRDDDPAETVEGFNCVRDDGDCGVTTKEMREYLAELPVREWAE